MLELVEQSSGAERARCRVDVIGAQRVGRRIGMIEGAAIGAEGGAVAGQQAAEDRPPRSVGVEPIEGRGRLGLVAGDAAGPEPTGAAVPGDVYALPWPASPHLATARATRFAPTAP